MTLMVHRRAETNSHEEVCITFLKHLESVFLGPNQDRLEGLRARIDEKCDSYKDGDLGHAEDTFALLWELAKKSVCSNPTAMDRTPYVSFPTSFFPENNLGTYS